MTTTTTTATPVTHEPARPPRQQGPKIAGVAGDAMVLTGRYVRHIARQPEELLTVVLVPTVMLLLFRYMLGGAVDAPDSSYVDFLIPGILTVGVTLTAMSTTVGVFMDMQEGFVDRLRAMSTLAVAVVFGHVVAAVLRSVIAVTVLIGLGLAIGYRPDAGFPGWLAAIGVLLLFAFAVGWLSALLGQIAGSNEGASGLALIVVFLPYASSLFAPTETMASGLRAFVENQPVTHVIESVRSLLLGQPVGDSVWLALVWWGGISLLCMWGSSRLFRRRFA